MKTVRDMKVGLASLKEIQTEIKLEMRKVGSQTKNSEINLINRVQDKEERTQALKTK